MSKNSRFTRPFDKEHYKRAPALFKSASQHLYQIHWSLPSQLSWKKSLFFTCQILGLFRHLSDYVFGVLNIEYTKSMRVISFYISNLIYISKCSKKLRKCFFFWDNCIWIGITKLSLLRTGYIWSAAQDLTCQLERFFPTQLTWQWSINMLNVLWCWFQQCFGMFTMLLIDGSSKTGLFRHLSDHAFRVRKLKNFFLCLR